MKHITRLLATVSILCLLAGTASAQSTINSTTFSSAVTSVTTNLINLTSVTCTGCTFGSGTWVYADQELMVVTGAYVSGTTNIPVVRARGNTVPSFHSATVKVFVGPATRFQSVDPPYGACLKTNVAFLPWININNGYRWTCDNGAATLSTQQWRAAVPWTLTFASDIIGKLYQPFDKPSASVVARMEAAASAFFRW